MPTPDRVPLASLLAELIGDLRNVDLLWQLSALVPALIVGWLVARRLRRHSWHAEPKHLDAALRVALGGLDRVVLPVVALALVLAFRWVLQHNGISTRLLGVAIPLLFSFVLVHAAVYLLRHAFGPSGVLRYWERAIAWTIWVGLALYITGLLTDLRKLLDSLTLTIGKQTISSFEILSAVLSVAVTVIVALWVGRLLESRLQAAKGLDPGLRAVFSKLARTALVIVAVLIALPLVGIDLTVLSVFGGALGVGVGLGLQKIAANYISGFIILLDRSVTPGALITIDGRYGEVTRLTARYLVLRGLDGTEAIIPNETIVSSTVINHSYTDHVVRVDLAIQISYRSDVERALGLMEEEALKHPRVLPSPQPLAVIHQFGESGIDLELFVWIADPETGKANLRSEVYLQLWKSFKAHDIEIPFPQREVRLLEGKGNEGDGQARPLRS